MSWPPLTGHDHVEARDIDLQSILDISVFSVATIVGVSQTDTLLLMDSPEYGDP